MNSLPKGTLIDLTESNPTHCGFYYPENLLNGFSELKNLDYSPEAAGISSARQSVAEYLSKRGLPTRPNHVVLTSSTSEAYSYLFKLLGEPGDSFLVPAPGYPLLAHLAQLESVLAVSYSFKQEFSWPLDINVFQSTLKEKLKAIISVNPQNPTGVPLSNNDLALILETCNQKKIAFISDEVFWDYLFPARPYRFFKHPGVLSFRLGGISKSLGLPQLKLAWIVVDGPETLALEAIERLEFIADTYLSVQTPVQNALPRLIQTADDFQRQVRDRIGQNRKFLVEQLEPLVNRVRLWPLDGGWYNLVEIRDSTISDADWVMDMLEKEKILIHPGSFYDILEGCFGVVSLICAVDRFETGVKRLVDYLNRIL